MFTLRSVLSVVAAATVSFLATSHALRAQTGERSRWDQVTLGNSYVGVDVIGWARTRNPGTERRVDEAAWTQLRLLNVTVELQRIAATASRLNGVFSGSTSFRRGGFTVRNDAFTNSGHVEFTSNASVFGSNPYVTVYLLGIPITVGANVGHTGVMNMDLLNWTFSNSSVLSGTMESYAYGWASVAVGVPGFSAGVQAEIRIGRQRFDGVLGAHTNYLSSAYLNYDMTPLRFFLRVYLELIFVNPSSTLVDVSLGARTLAPFML
jgi:hypothetical protein